MEQAHEKRELEQKHKAEIAKLERENQKLRDDAARQARNRMAVRIEKILVVVVVLAAVCFMHSSMHARMDALAAKADKDLQDWFRNTENKMFHKGCAIDAKQAGKRVSWKPFGVAVLIMIIAMLLRMNYVRYSAIYAGDHL